MLPLGWVSTSQPHVRDVPGVFIVVAVRRRKKNVPHCVYRETSERQGTQQGGGRGERNKGPSFFYSYFNKDCGDAILALELSWWYNLPRVTV